MELLLEAAGYMQDEAPERNSKMENTRSHGTMMNEDAFDGTGNDRVGIECNMEEEEEEQEDESGFDDEEESGSGASQGPRRKRRPREIDDSDDDSKRQSSDQHNENERKRRKNMKHAVHTLREQLTKKTRRPAVNSVLKAAYEEIQELKKVEKEKEDILEELKKNNIVLKYLREKTMKELTQQKHPVQSPRASQSLSSSPPSQSRAQEKPATSQLEIIQQQTPGGLGPHSSSLTTTVNNSWYWPVPLTSPMSLQVPIPGSNLLSSSPIQSPPYIIPHPSPSHIFTYPFSSATNVSPPTGICPPSSPFYSPPIPYFPLSTTPMTVPPTVYYPSSVFLQQQQNQSASSCNSSACIQSGPKISGEQVMRCLSEKQQYTRKSKQCKSKQPSARERRDTRIIEVSNDRSKEFPFIIDGMAGGDEGEIENTSIDTLDGDVPRASVITDNRRP